MSNTFPISSLLSTRLSFATSIHSSSGSPDTKALLARSVIYPLIFGIATWNPRNVSPETETFLVSPTNLPYSSSLQRLFQRWRSPSLFFNICFRIYLNIIPNVSNISKVWPRGDSCTTRCLVYPNNWTNQSSISRKHCSSHFPGLDLCQISFSFSFTSHLPFSIVRSH